ncbi:MAG: HXXEE domain-containing protein [Pseudomonadota bacterium]
MRNRLYEYWVYGGALASVILLLLAPLLGWPLSEVLIYLSLPAYMVHQYEEHDNDRFRLYFNSLLGASSRGLSHRAVFAINFAGVWLVILASLWLARFVSPGWGAIAAYLLLFNGFVHIAQFIILRRPNPGLLTAVFPFLPLGAAVLFATSPSLTEHIVSFVLIVVLHAAIVVHVRRPQAAS